MINLIEHTIEFIEQGELEVLGNVIRVDRNKVSLKASLRDTAISNSTATFSF